MQWRQEMKAGKNCEERKLFSYLYFEQVDPITVSPVANIQQPEVKYVQISVTDETNS